MAIADLPNGFRVVAISAGALPLAQVRWVFGAGRSLEPMNLLGCGLVLQRVMRHGTTTLGPAQFSDKLGHLGLRMGGGVSIDSAIVSMSGMSEHLPVLLELTADVALRPGLSDISVAAERHKAMAVHRHEWAKIEAMAALWMAYAIYGKHPYGRPRTTLAGLEHTQTADLKRLHSSIVDPGQGLVLAVGQLDVDDTVFRLSERLATIPTLSPAATGVVGSKPSDPLLEVSGSAILIEAPTAEACVVSVGLGAVPRSHPDYIALKVANQVFGGSASARLFRVIRDERSLSYGAYALLDCGRDAGEITVSVTVAPEKAGEALKVVFELLYDMANGEHSQAELRHAVDQISGALPHTASGIGGLSALATSAWLNGLDADVWAGEADRYAAVDLKRLKLVAARYFQPAKAAVVVVGSAAALRVAESQLSIMGLDGERKSMGALEALCS
jgi:predicted Zn-dependent peptidase